MKHDVDSCNFAMDIVMWEAHAKATRTRSLLEGGEAGGERKMKSGNSFEAARRWTFFRISANDGVVHEVRAAREGGKAEEKVTQSFHQGDTEAEGGREGGREASI